MLLGQQRLQPRNGFLRVPMSPMHVPEQVGHFSTIVEHGVVKREEVKTAQADGTIRSEIEWHVADRRSNINSASPREP